MMQYRKKQVKQTSLLGHNNGNKTKSKPKHSYSSSYSHIPNSQISAQNPHIKPPTKQQKYTQMDLSKLRTFIQKYHELKNLLTINYSMNSVCIDYLLKDRRNKKNHEQKEQVTIYDVPYIMSEQVSVSEKYYEHGEESQDGFYQQQQECEDNGEQIGRFRNKQAINIIDRNSRNKINQSSTKTNIIIQNSTQKNNNNKNSRDKQLRDSRIKINLIQNIENKLSNIQENKQSKNEQKIVISIQLNESQREEQKQIDKKPQITQLYTNHQISTNKDDNQDDDQNFTDNQQQTQTQTYDMQDKQQLESTNKNSKIGFSNVNYNYNQCEYQEPKENTLEDSFGVNQCLKKTAHFSYVQKDNQPHHHPHNNKKQRYKKVNYSQIFSKAQKDNSNFCNNSHIFNSNQSLNPNNSILSRNHTHSLSMNPSVSNPQHTSFINPQQKLTQTHSQLQKSLTKAQNQQNYNHLNKLKSRKVQVLLKLQNEQQKRKQKAWKIINQDKQYLNRIINKK